VDESGDINVLERKDNSEIRKVYVVTNWNCIIRVLTKNVLDILMGGSKIKQT